MMGEGKRREQIGDKPIEPGLRDKMNAIARGLDAVLNGEPTADRKKRNGFVLLVFPFENNEGRCNYISNAERQGVIVMLKEQLARLQGQPEVSGRG